MKNIKILIASCLMLVCAANLSAQWRFGVGMNYDINSAKYYETFSDSPEERIRARCISLDLNAEYVLPRTWTPNWMALSLRTGAGFMQLNKNAYNESEEVFHTRGIDVPLGAEVKFLLTDNTRFYINCGIVNNLIVGYGYDQELVDELQFNDYMFGYEYGAGFEFNIIRIGYKCLSFTNNIYDDVELIDMYKGLHTLSFSLMFNGNHFFKKKSKLKTLFH